MVAGGGERNRIVGTVGTVGTVGMVGSGGKVTTFGIVEMVGMLGSGGGTNTVGIGSEGIGSTNTVLGRGGIPSNFNGVGGAVIVLVCRR